MNCAPVGGLDHTYRAKARQALECGGRGSDRGIRTEDGESCWDESGEIVACMDGIDVVVSRQLL